MASTKTNPIKTVSSLLSWKPEDSHFVVRNRPQNKFCSEIVLKSDGAKPNRPKVLLCHDMKGGYLADCFDDGCSSEDEEGFGFSFWHWLCVDIFVYFSHELVTIPPRAWIELAKANGVKILGTFITEFDDGERIWTNEINSIAAVDVIVDKLVQLTEFYGFDGWLLNIENKIPKQADLAHYLTKKLTLVIHERIPGGVVIWYDSVTFPDGELKWQNELNTKNEAFFESCDGIFLNYTWTPDNLTNSRILAEKSNRRYDVFVGVDVFGRNCFGGGGFDTKLAVEQIVKSDLSCAIFAFGWVFETLPPQDFLRNQQKFWTLLHDLLPISREYSVPFSTVFSVSQGKEVFCLGEKYLSRPWYNLPLQTPCHTMEGSNRALSCNITDARGAFLGSSCLEVCFDSSTSDNTNALRLFSLYCPKDCDYHFCVAYKWLCGGEEITASFGFFNNDSNCCLSCQPVNGQDHQWVLESVRFSLSRGPHILKLIVNKQSVDPNIENSTAKPVLLIGYVGLYEATDESQNLSHNNILEKIKENVEMCNVLQISERLIFR